MTFYYLSAGLSFLLLSIMWSSRGILNLIVKTHFILITIWTGLILLERAGFIVKS